MNGARVPTLAALFLILIWPATPYAGFAAGPSAGASIPFVANHGQMPAQVAFSAETRTGTLFITRESVLVHARPGVDLPGVLSETLVAGYRPGVGPGLASPRGKGGLTPRGEQPAATRVTSLRGSDPNRWRSGIATYDRVSLGEPWPGIEVSVVAREGYAEKLFTVAPGASAGAIRVAVEGVDSLSVAADGSLRLAGKSDGLHFSAPQAYQDLGNERRSVAARYVLAGERSYGFALGAYRPDYPVVIDPILQSTYLGGTGNENFWLKIAVHPASGEVYAYGYTNSVDYPGTGGGAQPNPPGGSETGVVMRLSPDLRNALQATYFGGTSGFTNPETLVFRGSTGEVYLGGSSSAPDLPGMNLNSAQQTGGGGINFDGFVARFSEDLTTLVQATYFGAAQGEFIRAMAFDPTETDLYVAGQTSTAGLAQMVGGSQASKGALQDGFVLRVAPDLSAFGQGTYLGGNGNNETIRAIAFHPGSGELIVAGRSGSSDFPGVFNNAQATFGGVIDGFLARFEPSLTGTFPPISTYVGGSGTEDAHAVAIDAQSGDVFLFGFTQLSPDLPGTDASALQPGEAGDGDGFIARVSGDLASFVRTTYFGGANDENNVGDPLFDGLLNPGNGDIYVVGYTVDASLPGVSGGAQDTPGGSRDLYVARISPDLTTLRQASFVGGSNGETGIRLSLASNSDGSEIYVSGVSDSPDLAQTAGGAQPNSAGGGDGFIARLDFTLTAAPVTGGGAVVVKAESRGVAVHPLWVLALVGAWRWRRPACGAREREG